MLRCAPKHRTGMLHAVAFPIRSEAPGGDADVAAVAALIADRARAAMLDALMDGRACAAGELARRAGIAPSTASGHLARLLAGGLVLCEIDGRERRYRLASAAVADGLEALSRLAPGTEVRSLRGAERAAAIRAARTCYDHLAGRLGVGLTEALVERKALVARDASYELTATGESTLAALGVDVARARAHRRSFAPACVDWSERRPHLAGALGAALAEALLAQGWVRRRPSDRGLVVTAKGAAELHQVGVELR
jgi:DNA-binding transcriptional ArsR family regulator